MCNHRYGTFALLAISIFWLTGCAPRVTDLVATNQVKLEVAPSALLEISPSVLQIDKFLEVSGTVRRKDATTAAIAGHIDVEVLDREGTLRDLIVCNWQPRELPAGNLQRTTFTTPRYGRLPPMGATVRVAHRTDQHQQHACSGGGGAMGGGSGGGRPFNMMSTGSSVRSGPRR